DDFVRFIDKNYVFFNTHKNALIPGRVEDEHFWLLIGISTIHSKKVVMSMQDYLVHGIPRKNVCEKYKLSHSYFDNSLARLHRISCLITGLIKYYS
ncbi:TPA: PapB/FocB family fimbrial expression transcriptional regulator, partial [Escherichia coli]